MGNRIKGITVEIGGDTKGLNEALKKTNGNIQNIQSQLRDVEHLLKLDPTNTILLQQKQELLANSIKETEEKLKTLKEANEQAAKSADRYDAWKAKYTPIQAEIDQTKEKLKELETAQRGLQKTGDVNTSSYTALQNEIKETSRHLKDLKKEAKAVDDEFGNPISKEKYDSLQREIVETEIELRKFKESAKKTEGAVNGLGNASESTGRKIDGLCDVAKSGALLEAADQLSVMGDKILEIGGAATESFSEVEGATVKASAYFGETGAAAEETAQIIKDVYAGGVGESLDSVSNAVITVKKNLKDLDGTELKNLTQQAITLEELYGIDMNETMRGVNALMEQFGLSAQESMDYIVSGTQNGLDKTNELGDNLSEYAGKFAQAGYSADEYFQLLNNGLDGGAYNLDKVNDAINEVTTRLADGTISDAIGSYSQETQELFASWQAGGATQKEVIDSIVGDIASCTNEQEALNMAATAFGTMAEDGNRKFVESLTTIGSTYEDVSGSAQGMFDSTATPMQEMEANTRQLHTALAPLGEVLLNLANMVMPPLVAVITTLSGWFSLLPAPVQNFVVILGGLTAAFTVLTPIIAALALSFGTLNISLLPIIGVIAGITTAVTLIIAVFQNWGTIVEWFKGLWQTLQEAFTAAWNTILMFFTVTIPQAWQSLMAMFQSIPEWWAGLWQQISDLFGQVWTAMMQNPVLSAIVETIVNLWNGCMETLSMIWETIQTIAAAAWELIKNVILGPVLLLCDLVTGDFEKLKADAENIWNNIKNAANTIWNALKTLVVNLVMNLKNNVINTITGLRDRAGQLWEEIKSKASELWEGIKKTISDIVTNIKETGIKTFEELKDGIKETVAKIPQVVEEGFQGAIDFIVGLKDKAFEWGADFIGGLIDGIKSMIDNVKDAVSDVADTITDFLHFSRPDKGPLHYYEKWMPDFMKGLEKGISDNMWRVLDRMRFLNDEMANIMQTQGQQAKQPYMIQNYNVFSVDGKPIAEMVNEQLGMAL